MKKTIMTLLITLSVSIATSQVKMGGSLERTEPKKEIVKAPPYENHQNFVKFNDYYGYSYSEEETPTEKEFYSRYNDLTIFYPNYTNNYREKSVIIFKYESSIIPIKREYINERYFKIEKIDERFDNTSFFDKVDEKDRNYLDTEILLTLKDTINGETIYIAESRISFVPLPFYETLSDFFTRSSLIATQDFGASKLPITKTNGTLYIDKGTEWQGRFSLLRGRDLNLFPEDELTNEDQDLKYMAILGNGNDTIVMNITESNSGRWRFFEVLNPKHLQEKENQEMKANEKEELNKFVKKYGQNYGNLVYNKKATIGMTKEMCQDIYGITLNKKSYTDAKGEIEIWDYTGVLKLYFTNGKLSEIIKY